MYEKRCDIRKKEAKGSSSKPDWKIGGCYRLDEQVIPSLGLHDIAPLNVGLWLLMRGRAGCRLGRFVRRQSGLVLHPSLVKEDGGAAEAARVGRVAELGDAVLVEVAER